MHPCSFSPKIYSMRQGAHSVFTSLPYIKSQIWPRVSANSIVASLAIRCTISALLEKTSPFPAYLAVLLHALNRVHPVRHSLVAVPKTLITKLGNATQEMGQLVNRTDTLVLALYVYRMHRMKALCENMLRDHRSREEDHRPWGKINAA